MSAPVTVRSYARHQANWVKWCGEHAVDPLAPSLDALCSHLLDLGTRFSPKTIGQYCAAVRHYHHAAGLEVSPMQAVSVARVVGGLRAAAKKPPPSIPLSVYNLRRLLDDREIAPSKRLLALRDQALFAVLWAGNLRPSEVVRLETSHIVKYTTGQLTLWLDGRSISIADGPPARAVTRLTMWLKEGGIIKGRLFRNVFKSGDRIGDALTETSIRQRFRRMLSDINIQPDRYSLVSFRKGSVSSRGVDAPAVAVRPRTPPAASGRQPAGVPFETIAAIWQVVPEAPQ